jgi:small subunit ribosomal protein S16
VVADSRSLRGGKCIEEIGTYEPLKPGENFSLKLDRAQYWVSQGAQAGDTVTGFIMQAAVATKLGVHKLSSRDQGRLDALLAKNNEGTLSQQERVELNDLAKKVHEITIGNAKRIDRRRRTGAQPSDEISGGTMVGAAG